MLTLVINPGGTARVVTIAKAPYHLGVESCRPKHIPKPTPEERGRRRRMRKRERAA